MPSKAGSTAQSPTLILPELSFDDEGLYECEASNSEGTDSYQGRVNVQGDRNIWDLCGYEISFFMVLMLSPPHSSAWVAAGDERLRGGDQLRAPLDLFGCWKTSTLHPMGAQRTTTQHPCKSREVSELEFGLPSVQTPIEMYSRLIMCLKITHHPFKSMSCSSTVAVTVQSQPVGPGRTIRFQILGLGLMAHCRINDLKN